MSSNDNDNAIVVAGEPPVGEAVVEQDLIWFVDDFPRYGPITNRLSLQHKVLIESVHKRRSVVTDGITYYVYCEGVASWNQLYSEVAGNELLEITGINAPVNYSKALKWAYATLKRVALPISRLYPSLCLGTYRLIFKCSYFDEKITVDYRPHWPVIDNTGIDPMFDRIYSFVVSPIILPSPSVCPYSVTVRSDDEVINKILLPLSPEQKMDFMWRMGKAMIDPVKSPSVIVLYGRDGHEGKTVLAKCVTRVMSDAVEWVSNDLFGKSSKWPDVDTVMNLCQKRLLICDECKISDGFSYDNIKRWTSEGPVSMAGRTGYLSQTGIIISNSIPFFEKAAVNNSIGRRLVIYHMTKDLGKLKPMHDSEMTNSVALRFMSLCIAIATSFEQAPTSLGIALYTVFRKNINKITAGLVHDVAGTEKDMSAATSAMAVRCGVSVKKLCSTFSAISPSLVHQPKFGRPYIKSIRIPWVRLTKHGRDYVDKRVEAQAPTYNLERMNERAIALWD